MDIFKLYWFTLFTDPEKAILLSGHSYLLIYLSCRCAGDVIIIEVNRPPTHGSSGNDVAGESPGIVDDVTRRFLADGVSPCLEQDEVPSVVEHQRTEYAEEVIYVELDVDCAPASRMNYIKYVKISYILSLYVHNCILHCCIAFATVKKVRDKGPALI